MSQELLIHWEYLISISLAAVIFMYLLLFTKKPDIIKLYMLLFIPFFLFPLLAITSDIKKSSLVVILMSFSIYFLFILTTYRKYDTKKRELYYFIQIIFALVMGTVIYTCRELTDLLAYESAIAYLALGLGLLATIFHYYKKSSYNMVGYANLSALVFIISSVYLETAWAYTLSLTALTAFFLFHISNARIQVYQPLLNKIESLQKKLDSREVDMPEQIRQKFQILENNKAKLMDMAHTDKMTGVFNKGKLLSIIKDLIDAPRTKVFSIFMFDIDSFKLINDNLGHLVGDECIIDLARIGENSIRKHDYIARYGGDEFIVILPGIDAMDTKVIAERFRKNVMNKTDPKFTVSIGVASYPEDGKTVKQLIESADQALYLSKERGKNRVSHISLF